ncbi:hypothetical protein HAP41_0000005340 [Bradyrhizobium barranii subsp. apii]|uniref:Uncharacterized protein n=1 Tax=Bradyrhizobium barranii subsp. apii TaxID=2819348 RepID=A0A8T5VN70_9BRAD|nr:hypothetical protein [Bradyrhizobium barranii]UPT88515.1 hypothetical protein HAP41_0000005340 [Bradyrhizobium barranii subsp. apii]
MSDAQAATRKRAPRKTQFNLAERERLRAALRNYMQENRIGVPALQLRIAEGTDRSPDLLPLKTLQRFLADCGRTNDAFLQPCFQFAQSLPSTGRSDDFARELAGYFGLLAAGEGGTPRSAPVRFAGRYKVSAKRRERKVRVFEGDETEFALGYSTCTVQGNEQARFSFREDVFNPGMVDPVPASGARHSFEGALLFFDPLVFVVAKNLLTRLPRAYWLREFEGGTLMGYGMEAAFLHETDTARPYSNPVDFSFERIHEEATS